MLCVLMTTFMCWSHGFENLYRQKHFGLWYWRRQAGRGSLTCWVKIMRLIWRESLNGSECLLRKYLYEAKAVCGTAQWMIANPDGLIKITKGQVQNGVALCTVQRCHCGVDDSGRACYSKFHGILWAVCAAQPDLECLKLNRLQGLAEGRCARVTCQDLWFPITFEKLLALAGG